MYLRTIDQMVSQNREKNANRSVLSQPLFVLLVGAMSAERRQMIRDALANRWQSTRRFVNLCHIDTGADGMKFERTEHENLREVFMAVKDGAKQDVVRAQLSWWLFQVQRHVSKELGSLDGSHICVVCDGESAGAEEAAACCMMLNYWISRS